MQPGERDQLLQTIERNGDKTIDFLSQLFTGIHGRHRYGDHDRRRLLTSQGGDGRSHRRSGCDSIIHKHDDATREVRQWANPTVLTHASIEFLCFRCCNGVNHVPWNSVQTDNLGVEHLYPAACNCTHGQLPMPREAQLTNEKHVERCAQVPRDLKGHGDAAARQREHDRVHLACVLEQPSKMPAGGRSVAEDADLVGFEAGATACL